MNAKKFKELQMLMAEGDSEQIPHGWYTRQQLAKNLNLGQVTCDKLIKKLLERGHAERKMFRRPTLSGVRPVPYFSFCQVASEALSKPSRKRPRRQR